MKKRLIDLHFEWMETGTMGKAYGAGGGLCNLLPYEYNEYFELLKPVVYELIMLEESESITFWASGLPETIAMYSELAYSYTPRRQSIVLLICAMHGEL